ncbi:hypothetical protein [Chryseobacterium indologenes]|nr:hypothetical protein [Chryseobacterium indologenes]
MRGVVSLAAALAMPLYDNNGVPVPQRSTILFITFVVIIFTLLIQGLTLPKLIQLIRPAEQAEKTEKELNVLLINQSLSFLENMNYKNSMTENIVAGMIKKLTKEELQLSHKTIAPARDRIEWRKTYFKIELELIDFQRTELIKNYYKGEYSLEIIRKKEWELDFWATTVYHEIETLE